MKNRKLYLARFDNKNKAEQFYKVGQCYQYDAGERFQVEPDQYKDYDIKIMTSAWGPPEEVDIWERVMLKVKPKDFWVESKFSGVTEIRRYNKEELAQVFDMFKYLSQKWHKQRHSCEENTEQCC